MNRYALGIEYCGAAFQGWQRQSRPQPPRTVQCELEVALGSVADAPVNVFCAGRTDSGVHATGQVVHFETSAERSADAWVRGTNSRLPGDVRVRWARAVSETFHARHSAISREYLYVICNRPVRPATLAACATWIHGPLDVAPMHDAVQALVGEHDFSAFRAAGCESSTPMRRIFRAGVCRHGDLVALRLQGNAFLLHMVRNIAGSLLEVGRGSRGPSWIAELLAGRDRTRAGPTAPPDGLHLIGVGYPVLHGLPDCGGLPWFLDHGLVWCW